ncbi:MAG TPA: tetratricopeptide repeat protein [Chitinophagaceae bacterium]|nr:tetratricopeptide repeat protein [Chitinophagaceae bacterium]
MKRILQFFCFLLYSLGSFAATDSISVYWNKGNSAYRDKQYPEAIAYYEQLLQKQGSNALVYFNLGNAYYKDNKVSEAVLNYERALFYNPSLKQARDNKTLAQSRISNSIKESKDIFFVIWWKNLVAGSRANMWAVMSLIIFITFLLLLLGRISGRYFAKTPVQAFIFIPVFNIVILFLAFSAARHAGSSPRAVIMKPNTVMTIAPNVYKGQVILPEATIVETAEQSGNWVSVSLPDNRKGWIQRSELTFVHQAARK